MKGCDKQSKVDSIILKEAKLLFLLFFYFIKLFVEIKDFIVY